MRRRAAIEKELGSRADKRVLRWLGHVERTDEYLMARRVLMVEINGGRVFIHGSELVENVRLPGGSG